MVSYGIQCEFKFTSLVSVPRTDLVEADEKNIESRGRKKNHTE